MRKEISNVPFGVIAIQEGILTKDQVRRALDIQSQDDAAHKEHRLIGRILTDEGLIDDAQVYQILGTLHRTGIRTSTRL